MRHGVRIQIGIDEKTKEGEDMQNVEWEIKGDKLIIEIDLKKDFGPQIRKNHNHRQHTGQPEGRGYGCYHRLERLQISGERITSKAKSGSLVDFGLKSLLFGNRRLMGDYSIS